MCPSRAQRVYINYAIVSVLISPSYIHQEVLTLGFCSDSRRTRDRGAESGRIGAYQMLVDARKCRDRDLLAFHRSIPRGQEHRKRVFESQLGAEPPFTCTQGYLN